MYAGVNAVTGRTMKCCVLRRKCYQGVGSGLRGAKTEALTAPKVKRTTAQKLRAFIHWLDGKLKWQCDCWSDFARVLNLYIIILRIIIFQICVLSEANWFQLVSSPNFVHVCRGGAAVRKQPSCGVQLIVHYVHYVLSVVRNRFAICLNSVSVLNRTSACWLF